MRSFEVAGETCEAFVARVRETVRARGFAHIVALSLDGDLLVVRFSWAGVSTLRYRVKHIAGGFRAELEKQGMSPFHAPFRGAFEERFEQVIGETGATLV